MISVMRRNRRTGSVGCVVVTVSVDRVVPGVATSLSARAVDSSGREVEGVTLAPSHVSVLLEMQPVLHIQFNYKPLDILKVATFLS